MLAQLLVGRAVGLILAADEQIQIYRQAFHMEAVDDSNATLRVQFRLFRGPVGFAEREFHAVVIGIFDKQADEFREPPLLLAEGFAHRFL